MNSNKPEYCKFLGNVAVTVRQTLMHWQYHEELGPQNPEYSLFSGDYF